MAKEKKRSGWLFIIIVLVVLGLFSIMIAGFIGLFIAEPIEVGNVAVIEVRGVITSFDAGPLGSDIANSDDIIEFIEKADEDETVHAVIFLINSPGGAPVATDEIARAINSINKTKVAVIRDMGASGGYWIASTADHVIANPMSITGSVGVIGSQLEFAEFIEEYNVSYRRMVAGEYKDMGTPFRKMTTDEETIMQKALDEIHDEFINAVAENRDLDEETIEEISKGKIYTGRQAYELGLVDELGTIKEAEEYVKKVENLEEIELAHYKKPKTFIEALFDAMNENSFNIGKGIGSSFKEESGVKV